MERRQVRVRLALPWLGGLLQDLAAGVTVPRLATAGEWLLARGQTRPAERIDWRRWLLEDMPNGVDLLQSHPAGPSLCVARGGDPAGRTWACASPAHLLTAIDHLRLAARSPTLDTAELAALVERINQHFAGRGLSLHAREGRDWLLESAEPIRCLTLEPDAVVGSNLRDCMPSGPDGARVCALMNEVQMLLHDDPINEARVARGQPTVNAFWLWGFGESPGAAASDLPPLYTDDEWLQGLWRAHGQAARPLDQFAAGLDEARGAVLVGCGCRPPRPDTEALAQIESTLFAPLRKGLEVRGIDQAMLRVGERVCTLGRGARLRFWRRTRPLTEALA
jgi:hypothetical protein